MPLITRQILWIACLLLGLASVDGCFARETAEDSTAAGIDSMAQPLVSSASSANSYEAVRGIERDEYYPGRPLRKVVNTLFFLPRVTMDFVLRSAGFSVVLLDEKQVVRKFRDIFFIYKNKVGWFPVLSYASGVSSGYGMNLFYQGIYRAAGLKFAYRNRDRWFARLKANYTFFKAGYIWSLDGRILLRTDENFRFYGFGQIPANDSRNEFLRAGGGDYGQYKQQRQEGELSLIFRPSPDWEILYTAIYQRRIYRDFDAANPVSISNVFDIGQIPGFITRNRQVYNEFAFRLDTRENLRRSGKGIRNEIYFGLSEGIGAPDESRFVRAGTDLSIFIPTIGMDRLLMPRVVLDMVGSLNDDFEIPFAEYPRHPSFRGVSDKELLRTDNYMLVSSLEYQWPLTHHFNGHIFGDQLMVAPGFDKFTLREAPWAVGLGIDIHNEYAEIARLYISTGSEGIKVVINVGFSDRYKDRSEWK